MALLKQSTVRNRMFLLTLSSDHISPATGKTPTVNISKNAAAFGAAAGAVTEISGGWYNVALTTADSGTLGDLAYHITEASSDNTDFTDQVVLDLPGAKVAVTLAAADVSGNLPANIIQLLGTAWLTPGTAGTPDVNAKLVGGTPQTGRDLGASVLLSSGTGAGQLDFTSGVLKSNVVQSLGVAVTNSDGQAQAGAASTITLASGATATDDYFNGQWCWIVSGTGVGQRRLVTNYVGSTKVCTVHRPWAVNPDSTSNYIFEAGFDWLGTAGTVNDGSATTTGFVTSLTGFGDNFFNNAFLVFIDGAMRGESRKITGYTSSTGAVTLGTATVGTVANGVPFVILGRSE